MPAAPKRPRGVYQKRTLVDEHLGARIRQQRNALGLSQSGLANALGMTYQQIQKYERGTNRVSASTLYAIAGILGVPLSFFFENTHADGGPSESPSDLFAFVNLPGAHKLIYAMPRISNAKVKHLLITLACALADDEPPP
jgi:transcriptional regulator with XRE-family HTH domain